MYVGLKTKFSKKSLLVIILVLIVGIVLAYLLVNSKEISVSSYSECVAAGYEVNTDFNAGPPSCKTPRGRYFYPDNVIID